LTTLWLPQEVPWFTPSSGITVTALPPYANALAKVNDPCLQPPNKADHK
jgi:hypothetical protein